MGHQTNESSTEQSGRTGDRQGRVDPTGTTDAGDRTDHPVADGGAESVPGAGEEAEPGPDGPAAGSYGVGNSVRRREDATLITGEGTYTDDLEAPDALHLAIARSQFGHARIESIDTSAAEAVDGVVAVYTAEDVAASESPGTMSPEGPAPLPGQKETEFPMLAGEKVRYVGEAVAAVLAEDRYAAHDAADAIEVEYERLDAVTGIDEALADDAPVLHEEYDDNGALDWPWGDHEAVDEAFADADTTVDLEVTNQRVIPNAMEPRAALAEYDAESDRLDMHASTQGVHGLRHMVCEALGLPEDDMRVRAPEVGGGFGSKGAMPYHGEPLAGWCAMQVDRPVKWAATRTESHQTDHHGRDIHAEAELAVDDDGTVRAMRVNAHLNIGAYLVWGTTPASYLQSLLSSQYDIPAIAGHFDAAYTNTTPIAPYRGAGRPESLYITERVMNHAAAELGMDPAEFRRRNMIPADAFPFETATGVTYDSGDYEAALDLALETLDYEEWREKQADLREEGRYVGIGLGCFVENAGTPIPGMEEHARVELEPDGTVVAYAGTLDHGQGHRTAFVQVVAEELGVPFEDVEYRDGDTDELEDSTGTFASRSAIQGGSALVESAEEVREQAREIAAHHLETDPEDVTFDDGTFHVVGAPGRSVTIQEVAELVHSADDLPDDLGGDLSGSSVFGLDEATFPFGVHAAVVEVDPDTGELEFHEYVGVDDCGVQINPMIVEGQVHGGVAQGIGQALYEHGVYDDNGTLVTGSFQDYAIPKAHHVPEMEIEETETPSPRNPIGVKGVGESGTVGAPPAVVNAALDALRPLGVENLHMPLTPESLWQAVREADARDE